jgi:hypothetical protein
VALREIETWIEMSKADELGCKVMTIPHMDPDNISIYQSQFLVVQSNKIESFWKNIFLNIPL